MNTPHPTYPRLQALLGAALPGLQLSTAVAEALQDALAEANEQAPPSAFFARLSGIAHSHAADGQAWRERQLSEARGRHLAEATRCDVLLLMETRSRAATPGAGWTLLARERRNSSEDEITAIYRRAAAGAPGPRAPSAASGG